LTQNEKGWQSCVSLFDIPNRLVLSANQNDNSIFKDTYLNFLLLQHRKLKNFKPDTEEDKD